MTTNYLPSSFIAHVSLLALLFITTLSARAAKASGKPFTFQQPDGTTVSVRLLGDENFYWYQTVDGVLLDRVDNAFYVAQVNTDGSLCASKFLAHNIEARTDEEVALAESQNFAVFEDAANTKAAARRKAISGYPSSSFAPHKGEYHIPIILMNYTDTVFRLAKTETELKAIFDNYFNSTTETPYTTATRFDGYSSASMYFQDASNGAFKPLFDIYGPYTADHEHHYYGKRRGDSRESSLLKEAVQKADGDIDFSKYDSNNDGKVDIVYIVFAGAGANLSGDYNDFWPACWYNQHISTSDGKYINVIGGTSELATYPNLSEGMTIRSGIGVFCHEMSHGLGLPDLYNTNVNGGSGAQYNNAGPEDWDIMDGGENLYNGMWPCQYTAWEKDVMGWLTPEELTEPADITIYPLNKENGKAYRVTNPNNSNEYYIIENYQNDEWNYYINDETSIKVNGVRQYNTGLMISHLNTSSTGLTMTPNNTLNKPDVTIIPADGLLLSSFNIGHSIVYKGATQKITQEIFKEDLAGDCYPGSLGVTSLAAYNNYTGDDMISKYPITDIKKNADGSISFKFMGGTATAVNAIREDNPSADYHIYTIDGRFVGNSMQSLPHGLYIVNGKKIIK